MRWERGAPRARPDRRCSAPGRAFGLAAVELGSVLGARVIAAASSVEKLAACRQLGRVRVHRLLARAAEGALEGRSRAAAGVDVVARSVGGALSEQALRATAWRGRFVSVGFASARFPIPLNLLLLKGVQLLAFNIGPFMTNEPEDDGAQSPRAAGPVLHRPAGGRTSRRSTAGADGARAGARRGARAIGKVLIVT
jgi:NADPH2:quinone reductase